MEKRRVCHRCGTEVVRGSFCVSCTMELAMGLRSASYESKDKDAIINIYQREPMEGKMRFIGKPSRRGAFLCR